jgi:hypothetical protein
VLAAAATIVVGGGAAAPASAGSVAQACEDRSADDYDASKYAKQFKVNVTLRGGPGWGCSLVTVATTNNLVDYHCWARAEDGTTWTYLRTNTTDFGWVWDGYLKDGGSLDNCGT